MSKVAIPDVLDRGVAGWDACKLAEIYSQQECSRAIELIASDPLNRNPAHNAGRSINILTKSARDRIDKLSWAIFYIKQRNGR